MKERTILTYRADARYTIMLAENKGDKNEPELTSNEVVFEIETPQQLADYLGVK